MPWKESSVAQMREEFVKRVLSGEKTKSALCREYGISRPTGDKWISRFLAGGSLADHSRRPNAVPGKTPQEVEELIVSYRQAHPGIGAVKIHRILENKGYTDLPCSKTINNIMKRSGLILKEDSLAATPYKRFEKSYPNEMWQADYKGSFVLKNGERCHPLNIVDDYSRFNICSRAQYTETFKEIKPVMTELFREYGLPFSLLCDNGNPWGTAQSTGYTHFEVWLMELGILTLHGRPMHPQTQGKDESFNRSMTKELLKYNSFENMKEADLRFKEYRDFYNYERPHHSIGLAVPCSRYERSKRRYPETIEEWEYPAGCEMRTVKSTGYLTVDGQGYFLSEAFGGKEIAVSNSSIPHCIDLYFRQFRIGRIDCVKRVFSFKRAYLIVGDPRFDDSPPLSNL